LLELQQIILSDYFFDALCRVGYVKVINNLFDIISNSVLCFNDISLRAVDWHIVALS